MLLSDRQLDVSVRVAPKPLKGYVTLNNFGMTHAEISTKLVHEFLVELYKVDPLPVSLRLRAATAVNIDMLRLTS